MSTPINDSFIRELRREGLTVKTVKGWRKRGRAGLFAPIAVLEHHTASNRTSGDNPALGICTHGRSDLAGPLCQILIARSGVIWIIAAGRANHAGEGGPWRGIPEDSGNAYFVGIECENDGLGEKWSAAQLLSMYVVTAILLKRMDRTAYMAGGHKEWTTRKIDPHGIAMDAFRRRVRGWMRWLKRPITR